MTGPAILVTFSLAGCAAFKARPETQQIAKPAPLVAAALVVELDVEDMTRKEHSFEPLLREELSARGIIIPDGNAHAGPPARYVVHVRVEARNTDRGVAAVSTSPPRGSTRLDGASESDSDAFREAPAPETRAYVRPGATSTGSSQPVDDFDMRVSATVTERGSKAVLASQAFDERALGLQPVAQAARAQEWTVVYRNEARRIAIWLRSVPLR